MQLTERAAQLLWAACTLGKASHRLADGWSAADAATGMPCPSFHCVVGVCRVPRAWCCLMIPMVKKVSRPGRFNMATRASKEATDAKATGRIFC